MESICFNLHNEERGINDILASYHLTVRVFVLVLAFFKSQRLKFSSLLLFHFILLAYSSPKGFSTPSLAQSRIIAKIVCKTASLP